MSTLWQEMLKKIVNEYDSSPTSFLRQPTIRKTVHPPCHELSTHYYNEMYKDSFFQTTLLPKMNDTPIGMPLTFQQHPECSPLTVQHTYHLYLINKHLGIFIPHNATHIVEIGGGYGNLCRLMKGYGYSGRYLIVDFPEMLHIQQNYLSNNSIKDVEFHPLKMEQLLPQPDDVSVLIAAFSINEMPMTTRQEIEPYYKHYKYLFFTYNMSFDGVDNVKYFDRLQKQLEPHFALTWFKDSFKRSWFLLCKRKG